MRRYGWWWVPAVAFVVGYFGGGRWNGDTSRYRYYAASVYDFIAAFALVVPAIIAALLLGRRRWWTTTLAALAIACMAFGALIVGTYTTFGFCFEPGDVCLSSRTSRGLSALGVAAAIGCGIAVQRALAQRRARRAPEA